jgi:steroid delta-isomerase-like uncharacterized protein
MTAEQQKAFVRRYYDEIWTKGNLALCEELFTPDYVNIDPTHPGDGCARGPDGFRAFAAGLRAALQDMKMTIEAQYVDGDTVVSRWRATAVHRGVLNGIPPTGRTGETTGITISRFAGNRIVEDRAIWDALGLLRQLGVVP